MTCTHVNSNKVGRSMQNPDVRAPTYELNHIGPVPRQQGGSQGSQEGKITHAELKFRKETGHSLLQCPILGMNWLLNYSSNGEESDPTHMQEQKPLVSVEGSHS